MMPRLTSILSVFTALAGTALAASNEPYQGEFQVMFFAKRRPDLSRQEFWDYWGKEHVPKVLPLLTHFNVTTYTLAYFGGMTLPVEIGTDQPASLEPVEFDGIVQFTVQGPDEMEIITAHPYYLEIVVPDEGNFIDTEAFGHGRIASYMGRQVEGISQAEDVWVGDEELRAKYQEVFETYL